MPENRMRLQKYISQCGVYSRRKAEELIKAGYVKVNGRRAEIGDSVNPRTDKVSVHGKLVKMNVEKVYIMLNKPRGYIATEHDERGRKNASELVKCDVRVHSIGRLDMDSEGLLLFTNDGDVSHNICHPRSNVSKTYRVTVKGEVTDQKIEALSNGSLSLDGRRVLPADVFVIERKPDRTVLGFIITEGRNRQIRRMCEKVSLDVVRLKRTEICGIKMGKLKLGDWRYLNEREIRHLTSVTGSAAGEDEQ